MQRLKLYKSKKLWVVAGAGLIMLVSNGAVAHADEVKSNSDNSDLTKTNTTSTDNTPIIDKNATSTTSNTNNDKGTVASTNADVNNVSDEASKPSDNADTTAKAQTVDTTKAVDDTQKSTDNTSTTAKAQTVDTTKVDDKTDNAKQSDETQKDSTTVKTDDTLTKDVKADTTVKDDTITITKPQPQYQLDGGSVKLYYPDTKTYAKGLTDVTTDDKTVTQYYNDDNTQVKGDYREVDGNFYYFDLNTGNSVTGVQTIDNQLRGFDKQGHEAFKDFAMANNGDVYYFDEQGHHVTGLQHIDGNTYYFDSAGRMMKNYTAVIDGNLTTFDKATGKAITATSDGVKQGTTVSETDFTPHNASYDNTSASFDNVNDYITAESWYRPKDILDNGTNWRSSTADEKRPVLMSWQPNVTTEVAYLNTMRDNDLITADTPFTTSMSTTVLDQATNAVQVAIEKRITAEKSTAWLKDIMTKFVNAQPQWNETSETPNSDHLQGGALTYVNSKLTPDANSNFRLLNRTPTNQSGVTRYTKDNSTGGYELLLANDVDNSNPVVQAEQLNWLHYLTHFGSITNDDSDANFDGIRIDAVDNVDADLLQIAGQYFKEVYQTNKSDVNANAHLSLLEDWSSNDPDYVHKSGANQLSMDFATQTQLLWSLTKTPEQRATMQRFIEFYNIDRTNDSTENTATPNYSFIRAHDSEVQTIIAQIVKDLHPDVKNSLAPSQEQLAEAFDVYNKDMNSVTKKYTQYNMSSAYAMLLTNKDTVPRVYYGDMYTDDGQFMATKTPYYDAIDAMLKARIKYVAGGQTTNVDKNDILTSVRFGQNLMTANDTTTDGQNSTSGVGLVVSNNPDLNLADDETVTLHMGKAHANQSFTKLVYATADGVVTNGTETKFTDANGDLVLDNTDIQGYSNVQVSGYYAMFVPTDAKADQDVRTQADTSDKKDGYTLHSNSALDSNVIYEAFSNFQSVPTTTDEYANVKIAQNADLFKSWGVTSMQLAPQYRSSTDTSFLDSIIQNGYAFTDRYDLGFNTPTKYGTDTQLRDAIKALHASGIQAMADWVPDQIYNLPDSELVTASRTNAFGTASGDDDSQNMLYVSKTRGGGAYQAKYGGEFLEDIRKQAPDLFTTIQVSTGVPIDGSTKIKEWSAKYFNGSNIQGRGTGYVLSDGGTQGYFKVMSDKDDESFLPTQLQGKPTTSGFYSDTTGVHYYSHSGYQAKNRFVTDETTGYRYYFDKKGNMVTGTRVINGQTYYFLPNGTMLETAFVQNSDGDLTYYKANGKQAFSEYITDVNGNAYYFDEDGLMVTGAQTIDGHDQYFGDNGVQVKNAILTVDGHQRYYNDGNGNLAIDQFVSYQNHYYYADKKGQLVTGWQTINNRQLFFNEQGQQVKGAIVELNGKSVALSGATGDIVKNDLFMPSGSSDWYFTDNNGYLVTGKVHTKYGIRLFGNDGKMKTNQFVERSQDEQLGWVYREAEHTDTLIIQLPENDEARNTAQWSYVDKDGKFVTGLQVIDNRLKYFDEDGVQAKDKLVKVNDKLYYFARNSGDVLEAGQKVTINNVTYTAQADGSVI